MGLILSFDLAKTTGWCVGDWEYGIEDGGVFSCKNLVEAYKNFNSLIFKWSPSHVIFAKATRYYNPQRSQSRIEGVLLLAIERFEQNNHKIKLVDDIVDSTAKKNVMGSGTASKLEIMNHYGMSSSDQADACMFFDYYKIINNVE